MNPRVLVTYSSRTGWTVGVAQAIAAQLAESGWQAEVIPMQDVADLAAYDAVVAGSAVRSKAWLPEAAQFVRDHREQLRRKPFAAFLVCMTLAMPNGEAYRPHIATWLDPVCALVKPVSTGLFAGGLDVGRLENLGDRFKFRLSVMFGVWKEGDHRNWDAIRQWAAALPSQFQPA